MEVTNRLLAARKRRGLSAAELAERVGVTRQTIHAIQSGTYTPNTAVALRLARELGVAVEDLFELAEAGEAAPLPPVVLGGAVDSGGSFRLCRVGRRVVAAPWSPEPFALPPDLVQGAGASLGRAADANRLLLAGCDPAASLLAERLRASAGVDLVLAPASSATALGWLADGLVHIAGTHLARSAARIPPGARAFVLAEWEEGLVVAPGNPKELHAIADLARPSIRVVNRQQGAGARALLDRGLADAGIEPVGVAGYDRIAIGHLAAAWDVARGEADACVATRVAARAFGLDFVPLAAERYELAIPADMLDAKPVLALIDLLQRKSFRRELADFADYDTMHMGSTDRPSAD